MFLLTVMRFCLKKTQNNDKKKTKHQKPEKQPPMLAASFAARNRKQMPSIAPYPLGSTQTANQRLQNNFTGPPYCNINSKCSSQEPKPCTQLHSKFPYPAVLLQCSQWKNYVNHKSLVKASQYSRVALSLLLAFIRLTQILNFKTH